MSAVPRKAILCNYGCRTTSDVILVLLLLLLPQVGAAVTLQACIREELGSSFDCDVGNSEVVWSYWVTPGLDHDRLLTSPYPFNTHQSCYNRCCAIAVFVLFGQYSDISANEDNSFRNHIRQPKLLAVSSVNKPVGLVCLPYVMWSAHFFVTHIQTEKIISWNGPIVHVCCFMLARESTKTFVSRIHIRQPSPKNSEKNLRQPKNSLGSLVSRGITVLFFAVCSYILPCGLLPCVVYIFVFYLQLFIFNACL